MSTFQSICQPYEVYVQLLPNVYTLVVTYR